MPWAGKLWLAQGIPFRSERLGAARCDKKIFCMYMNSDTSLQCSEAGSSWPKRRVIADSYSLGRRNDGTKLCWTRQKRHLIFTTGWNFSVAIHIPCGLTCPSSAALNSPFDSTSPPSPALTVHLSPAAIMYHLFKGLHEYMTRKDEYSVVILGLDNVSGAR